MEYINQFHKESTERKLQELNEQKKLLQNANEEARKYFEMHKRLQKADKKNKFNAQ